MVSAMTDAVTIKRYPTRLHLRCASCQHEAQVSLFLEQVKRLRCRKCGSRNVTVISRDRLAAWSRRRHGK
jgi:Zn finger protein HypA/HybF involved in hydrogenase expression